MKFCTICTQCNQITGAGEGATDAEGLAKDASFDGQQYAKQIDLLIKKGFRDEGEEYEETYPDGIMPSAAMEHQSQVEQMRNLE